MSKAVLNITYRGVSRDVPGLFDAHTSDLDLKRIAVEVVRSGVLHGLHERRLDAHAFDHYVIDRFAGDGPGRLYLRPKVPFG